MSTNVRRIGSGICALGIALAIGGAAPATGAPYPNSPETPVSPSGGAVAARSAAPTSTVSAAGAVTPENLPFTGEDVVEMLVLGLGAAGAGAAAVAVARSRRRRPEPNLD